MQARSNVFNSYSGAPARNAYELEGAGLGLTANLGPHWHLALSAATRLGDDPTASAGSPGSSHQGWASLTYSF